MSSRPPPITPDALHLRDALDRSPPMARLRTLLAESDARFAAIRAELPAMLLPHVRPGPVDENGWSILAANAAVAAKLRQLQPRLERRLRDGGWQPHGVRVKVLSPAR